MNTTTVYKYEYTGSVESWGKGWYNPHDIALIMQEP